jgi:hypothetical protein
VIIEYGVGIDSDSTMTVNTSVKCDAKNESESMFWIKKKKTIKGVDYYYYCNKIWEMTLLHRYQSNAIKIKSH